MTNIHCLISFLFSKRKEEKMFNKKKKNIIYKKIYMPYYNETFEISPEIPEIYNNDGEKMDIFFIRDVNYAHSPYMHKSKYFLWDRFNIGLDTHFYTHSAMLETMGTPKRKYGWLIEPRTIMPKDYELFKKHKSLEKDFDAIFTYDEKILNTVSNAKFFTASATIWYGKEEGCSVKINPKTYQEKNKNISMICSDKQNSEYQKIRHF